MTSTKHAVLWVDHHAAHVVRLEADSEETTVIENPRQEQTHSKRHDDGHRRTLDAEYAGLVALALADVGEILLVGPSTAKDELRHYLEAKHPAVLKKILAVEAADHPTSRELAARGRLFFKKTDRMVGSHPI